MVEEGTVLEPGSYGSKKSIISFSDIMHFHFQKILNLTTNDYHGGYWKQVTSMYKGVNKTESIYVNDPAKDFINAVRGMRYALIPYFDKEMTEDDESITKELDNAYTLHSKNKEQGTINYRQKEIEMYHEMFAALSGLCLRRSFFKPASYTEKLDDKNKHGTDNS